MALYSVELEIMVRANSADEVWGKIENLVKEADLCDIYHDAFVWVKREAQSES